MVRRRALGHGLEGSRLPTPPLALCFPQAVEPTGHCLEPLSAGIPHSPPTFELWVLWVLCPRREKVTKTCSNSGHLGHLSEVTLLPSWGQKPALKMTRSNPSRMDNPSVLQWAPWSGSLMAPGTAFLTKGWSRGAGEPQRQGLAEESSILGPGLRTAFWAQPIPLLLPGCPGTQFSSAMVRHSVTPHRSRAPPKCHG